MGSRVSIAGSAWIAAEADLTFYHTVIGLSDLDSAGAVATCSEVTLLRTDFLESLELTGDAHGQFLDHCQRHRKVLRKLTRMYKDSLPEDVRAGLPARFTPTEVRRANALFVFSGHLFLQHYRPLLASLPSPSPPPSTMPTPLPSLPLSSTSLREPLPAVSSSTPSPSDLRMEEAFGARLEHSDGGSWDPEFLQVVGLASSKAYHVPQGTLGRQFLNEWTTLINACAEGKVTSEWLVMYPPVMLQRDLHVKSTADIRQLLSRRLTLWKEGKRTELIEEALKCAASLRKSRRQGRPAYDGDDVAIRTATCTRLFQQGKTKAAYNHILGADFEGAVLDPEEVGHNAAHPEMSVADILSEKHPPESFPADDAFIARPADGDGTPAALPTCGGVLITVDLLKAIAYRMKRRPTGKGPGGVDSSNLVSLMLEYGAASTKFCESLASLGKRIANKDVPFRDIRALVTSRIVPLDKKPGVRPIGVGNAVRRLLGKAMAELTGSDLEPVCGTDQLCIRLPGAVEGSIHAMRSFFEAHDVGEEEDGAAVAMSDWDEEASVAGSDLSGGMPEPAAQPRGSPDEGWASITVDADNAFNRMHVAPALWQARLLWPRCARFLFNMYRGYSTLFMYHKSGRVTTLLRREGITQGDPLSMHLYGLASLPLIRELRTRMSSPDCELVQSWYADDSTAMGPAPQVCQWFSLLCELGPKYGYVPQPQKTTVATRPTIQDQARVEWLFWPKWPDLQISHGNRYLGGYVGTRRGDVFCLLLEKKVERWTCAVERLTVLAASQPQAAYRIVVKHLYPEMYFLQRVTHAEDIETALQGISDLVRDKFIPALLGAPLDVIHHMEAVFRLPTRFGGLALPPPAGYASLRHSTSQAATTHLAQALLNGGAAAGPDFCPLEHRRLMAAAQWSERRTLDAGHERWLWEFMAEDDFCPASLKRALQRAKRYKTHGFLQVEPSYDPAFELSGDEFRTGLCLRYLLPLPNLPEWCDGCAKTFDIRHGLSCPNGGMVIKRHNAVRDFLARQVTLVMGGSPCIEPVIREADVERELTALVGDWSVMGFWSEQRLAFFDARVIDTDAASYLTRPVASVLEQAELEKKRKHATACSLRRGSFTPVILSVDGALAPEADSFLRQLAAKLAVKRSQRYSTAMGLLRQQLSCVLVRGAGHCVYGPRQRVRSRLDVP